MLMCKIQSQLKAIKNFLNTLKQLKILNRKIINTIMKTIGMNHSLHNGTYAECIKVHAISTFLK